MATKTDMKQTLSVRDKLLEALHQIDRPSEFCTWGDRPLTMPGLEVDGLGAVSLPLGKTQARKLIKLCSQAPYGKGTETVVDTQVRCVWELDSSKFQLTNPKWHAFVASIIEDVRQALGLEGCKLEGQLYKLLVYEEGSFFLPHRDGEKVDRMVATLVIGLPSEHEGGELIVSHDGRQHVIVFTGAASGYEMSYAAFYADCQHEIRPVRSGFRLCLTYNVSLAKSRGKKGIAAPSYVATTAAVGELLCDWQNAANAQKLAVTLDHRYTQDGLSIDKLKGIDRAKAEVLFAAAERADCMAHLALVTLWQNGAAEGGYDEYSYGYRRHWSDDEDEDDNYDSQYEMGEIYDHRLSASHWTDRHGKRVCFGEILLEENEIVSAEALDSADPNREEFEGPTGNAGMTLERWYHRAAVLIWPRTQYFHVLCSAGTDASIGGLEPMVKRLKRATKAGHQQQREECLNFANAIIDSWQAGKRRYLHGGNLPEKADDVDRSVFPGLLCQLDAAELMRRFLVKVLPADANVQLDGSFTKFCRKHGWETFEVDLTTVIEASTASSFNRNAELLRMLCVRRDKDLVRIELCQRLSERTVKALQAFDRKPPAADWQLREVDRAALLSSLVTAMLAIDAEKQLAQLIDHVLTCKKYDLTDAQLTAIFALQSRLEKLPSPNSAIERWLAACRHELESRTAEAPAKPADYRRADKLSCNCGDCRALSTFLANPDQREGRFPLAKERRRHLHGVIDSNRCDCTHVTEPIGRPYTLVCTKTTASYDTACKIHQRDSENLSRIIGLQQIMPSLPTGTKG